jgi:hypothetical protein
MTIGRWLAAAFFIFSLAGCTQPIAGPGQGPLVPPSPRNTENVHDRGLGGGN